MKQDEVVTRCFLQLLAQGEPPTTTQPTTNDRQVLGVRLSLCPRSVHHNSALSEVDPRR
jgi:hypothetical protein